MMLPMGTTSFTLSTQQISKDRTIIQFKRLSSLRSSNIDGESKEASNVRSLKDLLLPDPKCNPTQMSPTSLAYVGDSVFELFVRTRYVWPSRRTSALQKIVVDKVRGEFLGKPGLSNDVRVRN